MPPRHTGGPSGACLFFFKSGVIYIFKLTRADGILSSVGAHSLKQHHIVCCLTFCWSLPFDLKQHHIAHSLLFDLLLEFASKSKLCQTAATPCQECKLNYLFMYLLLVVILKTATP